LFDAFDEADKVHAPTWPIETIDLDLVDDHDQNPNQMESKTFSALVDEIAESGWLVPIQVAGPYPDGRYKMIGGHHRKKAAVILGYEAVPAVIVDPEVFDEDKQKVQLVKQNILHGQLNPEKFTNLFNELARKYDADMVRNMMGFTRTDSFNKVYLDAKKALPPEMQEKLAAVREELKTVDDLSLVLNKLFTEYGSTLDANFMVFSFGGRQNLMVQMNAPGSFKRMKDFMEWCYENKVKVDEEIMTRMDFPKM
jgi:hypothetical protein